MDRARPWVMRVGKSGMATVLVVTSHADTLDTLADELAGAGYYAFVALPPGVDALYPSTVFDLIILLNDVDDLQRARITALPFIRARDAEGNLVMTHVDQHNLVAVLRGRLDPMWMLDK